MNQVLARLIPEGPLTTFESFNQPPPSPQLRTELLMATNHGDIYSWRQTQSDKFTATKSRRQSHVNEFTSANLVVNSQTSSWPRTHRVKLQAENLQQQIADVKLLGKKFVAMLISSTTPLNTGIYRRF